MKTENTVMTIRNVPKRTRDQFKAYCAEQGKSMNEVIVNMLQEAAQKRNKQK